MSEHVLHDVKVSDLVQTYFKNIRREFPQESFTHVIITESNFGGTILASSFFQRAKFQIPNILEFTTSRHPDNPEQQISGVNTFHKMKVSAVKTMQWMFAKGKILFYKNFVTLKGITGDPLDERKRIKELFFSQCEQLHRQATEHDHSGNMVKWTYTAKRKGEKLTDDLLMAAMFSIYWSNEITRRSAIKVMEAERAQREEEKEAVPKSKRAKPVSLARVAQQKLQDDLFVL
jgi:hypothetical protein